MLKRILLIVILAISAINIKAEVGLKWGVRGGFNVTDMMFRSELFSASNRTGFYFGPTAKLMLPLGFDIEASLLYNQLETKAVFREDEIVYDYPSLVRKSIALPLNVKKGFGFGDMLNVFVFAGPQVDMCVDGDQEGTPSYSWDTLSLGINVGAGVQLWSYLEFRANYCIPCGTVGEFSFDNAGQNIKDGFKSKTGTWQVGVAVYF